MNVEEKFMDVLQNIEFEMLRVWRKNPSMTDYAATRAYEEAVAYYSAVAQAQAPKPTRLTGLDLQLFQAIQGAADRRLAGFTPRRRHQGRADRCERPGRVLQATAQIRGALDADRRASGLPEFDRTIREVTADG